MQFIKNKYYQLKLWIWWNFVIKKNEFSKKLDLFYIKRRCKKLSLTELSYLVVRQRQLAHDLDNGDAVSVEAIIKSRIAIF
jgi:hypothetical protein